MIARWTCILDLGSWRGSLLFPLSLECEFHLPFPQSEPFQICILETVICGRDHQGRICHWTPLKPPLKTCTILAGRWEDPFVLPPPNASLVESPLACWSCHVPVWSGLPDSPRMGDSSEFHLGKSRGCELTGTQVLSIPALHHLLKPLIFCDQLVEGEEHVENANTLLKSCIPNVRYFGYYISLGKTQS